MLEHLGAQILQGIACRSLFPSVRFCSLGVEGPRGCSMAVRHGREAESHGKRVVQGSPKPCGLTPTTELHRGGPNRGSLLLNTGSRR